MNSSTDADYEVPHLEFAAAGLVFVAGLIIQSSIIAFNVMDWLKGGPMTAADQIITSSAISRFVFHLFSLFYILKIFYNKVLPAIIINIFAISAQIAIFSSIWLSALLSIVFFLKISTFQNLFSLRLKAIISQKPVYPIVLLVLWSSGFTFFIFVMEVFEHPLNSTMSKVTEDIKSSGTLTVVWMVWYMVPLFLYFLSTLLIIIPLCLHVKKMKSNENLTCRVDTYIKTIIFIILSFFMSSAFIIFSITVLFLGYLSAEKTLLICNTIPLSHSVYLIYATTKLRNHFSKIVHGGAQCVIKRSGSVSESGNQLRRVTQ